jgi:hypothetical protein
MRFYLLTAVSALWLASTPSASATILQCASGAVSTLAGTTCSIGNLDYTFGAASIRNDGGIVGLTTASIFLTVNPVNNGFTLSGIISETNATGTHEDELDWSDTFSTIDTQSSITGVTAGVTGTIAGAGLTAFVEDNQVAANNGSNTAISQPGLGNGASCGVGFGVSGNCTKLFNVAAVSATGSNGTNIIYGIIAVSGGSASITSAEYFVTGVPAGSAGTPEPATAGLLMLGLGLMVAQRRSRRRS